jgi:hypothetical protein
MAKQDILKKLEALEAQAKKGAKVIITYQDGNRSRCDLCDAISLFLEHKANNIADVSIIGDGHGQGILPDLLLYLAKDI